MVLGCEDTAVSEFNVTFTTEPSFPPYLNCKPPLSHSHSASTSPGELFKNLNFIPIGSDWPGVGPMPHFQKLPRLRPTAFTPFHTLLFFPASSTF